MAAVSSLAEASFDVSKVVESSTQLDVSQPTLSTVDSTSLSPSDGYGTTSARQVGVVYWLIFLSNSQKEHSCEN
jgi:hypothetical protein